jgi:tripartite-type tricarboxylate transporter receptor subunit TctC
MTTVKLPRRQFLHLAAVASVLALVAIPAYTAQSQTRTIKFVIGYASGGGGSVLTRVLADQIERQQGVTAIVENRPGAATVIATEAVARAAPDGNTVLITNAPLVTNPHFRKQNYDPFTSFEPVCAVANVPGFIAVSSASPYRNLSELLAAARARPGEVTIATFVGTVTHLALELLKQRTNVNITFVPFPGGAPAMTALLGGHVTAVMDNYGLMAEQVAAGKLRVLATIAPTRMEALPDIPTVAEAGVPGYGLDNWWGSFVPAKTPAAVVAQFANGFAAAAQSPAVKSKLAPIGFYPINICGTEFAALMRRTSDSFGRIIREANIKME